MKTYLGIDGGGTKTQFALIDDDGRLLARHQEGSAYYLEIGVEGLQAMLARGIRATFERAARELSDLSFAFIGIPAFGEDSRLLDRLGAVASPTLPQTLYKCGNDMICGWAGALGCRDGISVVSGTGSIAYGEYDGRSARSGGWGELFSDEGSAYWVAREGLVLFSRMSDGRTPRGPLYGLLRKHLALAHDLDLCATVYGPDFGARSAIAGLAPIVTEAAQSGDREARRIFARGAVELAAIVTATRSQLVVPEGMLLPVSYSGGMFKLADLLLAPLQSALSEGAAPYTFVAPRMPPDAGAAIYAARCRGVRLADSAVAALEGQMRALAVGEP